MVLILSQYIIVFIGFGVTSWGAGQSKVLKKVKIEIVPCSSKTTALCGKGEQ